MAATLVLKAVVPGDTYQIDHLEPGLPAGTAIASAVIGVKYHQNGVVPNDLVLPEQAMTVVSSGITQTDGTVTAEVSYVFTVPQTSLLTPGTTYFIYIVLTTTVGAVYTAETNTWPTQVGGRRG